MKIHVVYEYTYFSIFIMISFVANAYESRAYLEYVLCFLWSYIISFFDYNIRTWIQAVILEQVFLKKILNFNM